MVGESIVIHISGSEFWNDKNFEHRRKVPFVGGGRRSILAEDLEWRFFIFLIFNFYFEGVDG